MRACARLLFLVVALVVCGAAAAQETKGWLGAELRDVTKAEADKLGWDAPRGAMVVAVVPGSPAARVGIKAGDILVAVDRTMIDVSADVDAAVSSRRPGAEVRVQVLSGGRERRVSVTLAERPSTVAGPARGPAPLLMLDSGGHMAKINGLAFTPDGRFLVSAGDDKTVRIWDWRAARTVRMIHGEVNAGEEGKIFAMALSPDGRLLATGGWFPGSRAESDAIRLYDFATGRQLALLKGHNNVVNAIAFSPDGRLMLSGSGGREPTAIIWDVAGRRALREMKGHKDRILAVGFTPDGARAVTASDDSTLRLWRVADGGLIAVLAGHKRDLDRALAIRAQDSMIASGDATGEIRLWDGYTGQYLRTLGAQKTRNGPLRFTSDGRYLISTCSYGGCGADGQHVWEVETGREVLTYKKHASSVLAAAATPDGRLLATGGGDNQIHIWDPRTGETKHILSGTGSPTWAVGFSQDGRRLAWGRTWSRNSHWAGYGPLTHAVRLPAKGATLGAPERISAQVDASFVRGRATAGGLTIVHRRGGDYDFDAILDLKEGERTRVSMERDPTTGYQHRSYSFSWDGTAIISGGGNGSLSAYDLRGQKLGEFVGHEGDVWAVTASPDGRLLASASHDQTVRLWNVKTRELIVTLFHGGDDEWVMWTPQGYYTGSPGADKIVGWLINRGTDQPADHVGAEQLRQHLNRPDIVDRAIVLASAQAAVAEASGTSFQLADLLRRPVPRLRIISPAGGSTLRGGRTTVKIAIDATPDPVKAIRVQVNGLQVDEETPDVGSGGFKPGEYVLKVPLSQGRNDVRITLTNAIGEKAETLTLVHEGEGDLDKRGTLYIVAIGVDKYPGLGNSCGVNGNASCDLRYPSADARRLVQAIERRVGSAHLRTVTRLLVNGGAEKDLPTAANILDAIDMLKQARETDTVVLFIAGHGVNDGASYRFLPTNAEIAPGGTLRGSTVVPWHALQEAVETAKGRRILFVDTCHSGNAYNQRLGNAAYHANIIAYTAARFDQEAIEDPKLGHGLFTYAVVEGLEGKGGLAERRQISTKDLADYVVRRVSELAKALKGEQEPQYFKGRDASDYVLARW